jgi:hypothetical protein
VFGMSTHLTPNARPSFSNEAPMTPDPATSDALLGGALLLVQELRRLSGHGADHPAELGLRRAIAVLASAAAMGDDRETVQRRSARVFDWLDSGPEPTAV